MLSAEPVRLGQVVTVAALLVAVVPVFSMFRSNYLDQCHYHHLSQDCRLQV
jgi:hypothetical protein